MPPRIIAPLPGGRRTRCCPVPSARCARGARSGGRVRWLRVTRSRGSRGPGRFATALDSGPRRAAVRAGAASARSGRRALLSRGDRGARPTTRWRRPSEFGYPVVVKADAAGLAHKTEAGAVIVDVATPGGRAHGVRQIARARTGSARVARAGAGRARRRAAARRASRRDVRPGRRVRHRRHPDGGPAAMSRCGWRRWARRTSPRCSTRASGPVCSPGRGDCGRSTAPLVSVIQAVGDLIATEPRMPRSTSTR